MTKYRKENHYKNARNESKQGWEDLFAVEGWWTANTWKEGRTAKSHGLYVQAASISLFKEQQLSELPLAHYKIRHIYSTCESLKIVG